MTIPHDEVACQELVELVTPYLEGVLPSTQVAGIEHHLGECSGCRAYVEQMRQTIHAIGHIPHEPISSTTRDEVMAIFRTWKTEREQTT